VGEQVIQDVELFVAIAEIAGVFVGFGALISVSGRDEIRPQQLGQIRAVVTIGLVVIVAALVPVILGRYGATGHALWLTSSVVFLGLIWAVIVLSLRSSGNREVVVGQARSSPTLAAFFWLWLEIPIQLPLVLTILGLFPDLEPAFYLTALAFNLFEAAFVLAQLVYARVRSPGT
jgi:hypothetical protein